jgi:hypothetical protein
MAGVVSRHRTESRQVTRPIRWALLVLVLFTIVYLGYLSRHLTFFYDEWDYIFGRRGWSLEVIIAPHNNHL